MNKPAISFSVPMVVKVPCITREVDLRVFIHSKIQNKRVEYRRQNVGKTLQFEIDKVFTLINQYSQDFVIENISHVGMDDKTNVVELRVNVFGLGGKALVDAFMLEKPVSKARGVRRRTSIAKQQTP